MAEKVCSRCHVSKPIEKFGILSTQKDGHHYWCKDCKRAYERTKPGAGERGVRPTKTEILSRTTKVCWDCKRELPVELFNANKSSSDGLSGRCSECNTNYLKGYYQRNHEVILEQHREYAKTDARKESDRKYHESHRPERLKAMQAHHQANREKHLTQMKAYWEANKETLKAQQAERYFANPEAAHTYQRDYYRRNVDNNRADKYDREHHEQFIVSHRQATKKHRVFKFEASGSHTWEQFWSKLVEEFEGRCAYCLCELTVNGVERDHVVALSKGGGDDISNIVPACRSCNASKGDSDLKEWLWRP